MVPGPSRERLTLIQQEVQQWQVNEAAKIDSSTGLRLEFYHNTMQIIAAHPLTGVGTGGFPRAYAKQVEGSGKIATRNPHNEFLLIAAQIGMLGLVVLLAMLWQQWRAAGKLDTPMEQALARALVLTLATGCLVNSLLLDHTEGIFYAWLSGLLYGGLIHGQPEKDLVQK
jgi:O-antigen ligase